MREAIDEMILFPSWQFEDLFVVISHIGSLLLLAMPLFAVAILERIVYEPFSLIPSQYLITLEDVTLNIWTLPDKIYYDTAWLRNLTIGILCFWGFATLDLLIYYK